MTTAFHSHLASQLTRRGMFGIWEASADLGRRSS